MNPNLQVVETNNQRVLTTAQIAEQYGTDARIITNNFNRNKKRYTEGKHYFALEGEEKKAFLNLTQIDLGSAKNAKTLYLWTEKGALLHAKSLNTDQAWQAYEVLVDTYFSVREQAAMDSYMIADPVKRAERWIEEQREKQQLETTVAVQEQQIAELQPKASYYDVVLNCKDLLSITSIAKDYGKSGVWLNRYLHQNGVQYKQGQNWLLYQKYAEKGYTSTKTQTFNGVDGQQHTKVHTYWTQKGRLFIYDLLKANGLLPLIEQDAV